MKTGLGIRRSIVIALSIMMVLSNFSFVFAESAGPSDTEAYSVTESSEAAEAKPEADAEADAAETAEEEKTENAAAGESEDAAEAEPESGPEAAQEADAAPASGLRASSLTAQAQDAVSYLDEDGQRQFIYEYTEVTSSTTNMSDGWYVVRGNVSVGRRIDVTGTVHLLLCDYAVLNANDGVHVSAAYGGDLTVCAQSRTGNTGTLNAYAASGSDWAGIGGNKNANGGPVTILGGRIDARGGESAAGIGGGEGSSSGRVRIYEGIVTARGGKYAAGIGGGEDWSGCDVSISGGTVTAEGGDYGAGIGGGEGGSQGGKVTISGGDVTARGGYQAAGIGGGQYSRGGGDGGTVMINGGTVRASAGTSQTGRDEPVAIGRGGSNSGASSGALEVYNTAKVSCGSSLSALDPCVIIPDPESGKEYSFRVDDKRALRCSEYPSVRIEHCTGAGHSSVKYADNSGHGLFCRYCSMKVGNVSAHTPDDQGYCTVCGYDRCPVKYIDAEGTERICEEYTDVYKDYQSGGMTLMGSGWYAVRGTVSLTERLEIRGDVNIILCDGADLKADGGIFVNGDAAGSLTVYAMSEGFQAGKLEAVAKKSDDCAGIGGNKDSRSGSINIHGGQIYAVSPGDGAGIGSAEDAGQYGDINITGGTVVAEARGYGAGIGAGDEGSGGNIRISGGTVNAKGIVAFGAGTSGVSAGYLVLPQYAAVTYSDEGATERTAVEIVRGVDINDTRISACREHEDVLVRVCDSHSATYHQMADGHQELCKYCGYALAAKEAHKYSGTEGVCSVCGLRNGAVNYIDENDNELTCAAYTDMSKVTGTGLGEGWYVVTGSKDFSGRVSISGDVNIILCDGSAMRASKGIYVPEGASLSLWCQKGKSGRLEASAEGSEDAGIGGNDGSGTGTVTIHSGTVTAQGGKYGAGIGSGDTGSAGRVNILGGSVTANGGNAAAGIGGGDSSNGADVSISGGSVTAQGGQHGAGIGGGEDRSGGSVTIEGGSVTANGGEYGAGIGGGYAGSQGGDVRISGGVVNANGGTDAAGIGGGRYYGGGGAGGDVYISGGKVTAAAGTNSTTDAERAVAIGKGGNRAGLSSGSLIMHARISVTYGAMPQYTSRREIIVPDDSEYEYTSTLRDDRSGICQSYPYVELGLCSNHSYYGFIKDSRIHQEICRYCGRIKSERPHEYDSCGICAECGYAGGPVTYVDENGKTKTWNSYTDMRVLPGAGDYELPEGKYVVRRSGKGSEDLSFSGRLTVKGDTKIVVCDGCTLNANAGIRMASLQGDPKLTFYVQKEGSGIVNARGRDNGAGIGGNEDESGGTVTINGGTINASGGSGAGIGGGKGGSQGGTVTINGGTVTAASSEGAGIGGGLYSGGGGAGGTVNINAGIVTASGRMAIGRSAENRTVPAGELNLYERAKVSYAVSGMNTEPLVIVNDVNWNDFRSSYCQNSYKAVIEPCVKHEATYYRQKTTHHSVCRYCGISMGTEAAHTYDEAGFCTVCGYGNGPVKYVNDKGREYTCSDYSEAARVEDKPGTQFTEGWYVVRDKVVFNNRIDVVGDVDIILCDGAELEARSGIYVAGRYGGELTVWSQKDGTGKLTANVSDSMDYAGIGGNAGDANYSGTVSIYGGVITAKGGKSAAGIGGGEGSPGGEVNILGGSVTANGGAYGAGIGGGEDRNGGIVTVNGGTVTARGGKSAAGIGGGYAGNQGGRVKINGGIVRAEGGDQAAGIGGGRYSGGGGAGGDVSILGGFVIAKAGTTNTSDSDRAVAIGNGGGQDNLTAGSVVLFDRAKVSFGANESSLSGYELLREAKGSKYAYSSDLSDQRTEYCSAYPCVQVENCTDHAYYGYIRDLDHQTMCKYCGLVTGTVAHARTDIGVCAICGYDRMPVRYYDRDGNIKECSVYTDISELAKTNNCNLEPGWYVLRETEKRSGTQSFSGRLQIYGKVTIILCDDTTLNANKGIHLMTSGYNPALTVWGQSKGSGQLNADASGEDRCAGIGGDKGERCGDVTIWSGRVLAKGGKYAAGIGGGDDGDQGLNNSINIFGGNVTAYGGAYGAGIGGGDGKPGRVVNITGAAVSAYGGTDAAGIGGGEGGDGGEVVIDGNAEVVAAGSSYGAGIGGGEDGKMRACYIRGGKVVAIAGNDCKCREESGGSAIGCGQGVSNKENAGAFYLYTDAKVTGGDNASSDEVSGREGRWTFCRWRNFVRIDKCGHDGAHYAYVDESTHRLNCDYCYTGLGDKVPHELDENGDCACGYHSDLVKVYYVEQNADGSWTAPASPAETVSGSYKTKAKEHFTLSGYSSSFESSEERRTPADDGVTIDLSGSGKTLYIYYRRNVNYLTFYSDIAGRKISEVRRVRYGADLSAYKDVTASLADHTFAGWSENPKASGSYSYKDTIPDNDPSKSQADREKHPYIIYGFGDTMPDAEKKLYPVFVQDRLEVHLDLGAYDAENSSSWYDGIKYDRNTPACMNVPGADGKPQSREFTVNVNEKLDMTAMNAAVRDGYVLAGWYTQTAVPWNESWGVTPSYCDKDKSGNPIKKTRAGKNYDYYTVTLTAGWRPVEITVAYDAGEHGSGTTPGGKASLGSPFTLASAPVTDEGYVFSGWKDKSGKVYGAGQELLFSDWSLTENGVLRFTAQYEKRADEEHIIMIDTGGGTYLEPIRAKTGDKINEPAAPSRTGYTFSGWYLGDAEAVFPITVGYEDIVLTAQWTAKEYTMSLRTGGGKFDDGTTSKEFRAAFGEDIRDRKPENPVWEHYEFTRWAPEYPDTMPAGNTTLQAIWMPLRYSMTFDADGGSFSDGRTVKRTEAIYDATVAAPDDPVKRGCVFEGWTLDGVITEIPSHMPDGNPVYKAKWHTHVNGEAVQENAKEPTCTADGSYDSVIYCSECGAEVSRTRMVSPALGHEFDEWETVADSTETAPGLKRRECARCHALETAEIPVKGHTHSIEKVAAIPATCTIEGRREHYRCTGCSLLFDDADGRTEVTPSDLVIRRTEHTWDEGELTREPSAYEPGVMTFTCTICGEKRTESVPWEPPVIEMCTVSFDAGGGSGYMAPEEVEKGEVYMLPENGFTAPEGMLFNGWSVRIGSADPVIKNYGKSVKLTDDAVVTARWRSADDVPVEYVAFDKSNMTLKPGDTAELKATVMPDNATDKTLTWLSTDERAVKTDQQGHLTAVSPGVAVITATSVSSGVQAICTVMVEGVDVSSVELDRTRLTLAAGSSAALRAVVKPDDASVRQVTWESSSPGVASVDANGKVTAKAVGTAVITVTTVNRGLTAECVVTVTKPAAPAQKLVYVKDLKPIRKFKVRAGKKKGTLSWKKPSKKVRRTYAGYEIQYSRTKSFKKPVTKYAKKNSKKKVIKGLKKKKTYYVRMRAYRKQGNVIHISKWTKRKKIRVR